MKLTSGRTFHAYWMFVPHRVSTMTPARAEAGHEMDQPSTRVRRSLC
jgi:hypothetical protein